MDFLSDMTREVAGLLAERAPKVEVRVGSAPEFLRAIEQQVGPLKADPRQKPENTFCGVPVIEDWKLPKDMVAILQDGELVNVIRISG